MPNDHYFIHKGVVFSDRSPKPHYPEMKRVYQWIGFEPDDLAAGKVKIRNKYAFINLDKFHASWTLSEDGKVIDHGSFKTINLAPATEEVMTVPFKTIVPKAGAEYDLRLSFTLAKDELWAKAGYEIAAAQFKVPVQNAALAADTASMKALKLDDNAQQVTVAGDGFSVVFRQGVRHHFPACARPEESAH